MEPDFTTLIESALESIPGCESQWRGDAAADGESGDTYIHLADGRIFHVTYERNIAPPLNPKA